MKEKKCFVCGEVKPIDKFYKHSQMADGHLNKCKECCKKYERERDTRHIDIKRYRQNPKRYLAHKYTGIVERCSGKRGHKSYYGREYLSEDEWWKWVDKTYKTFMSLYLTWQESGYSRRKAPSVDRVDNSRGYTPDNMQWLTLSANCMKTKYDKKKGGLIESI